MHCLDHGTCQNHHLSKNCSCGIATHGHDKIVKERHMWNRHHTGATNLFKNRTCGITTGNEQPAASAQQGHRPPCKDTGESHKDQGDLPQRHNKRVNDLEEPATAALPDGLHCLDHGSCRNDHHTGTTNLSKNGTCGIITTNLPPGVNHQETEILGPTDNQGNTAGKANTAQDASEPAKPAIPPLLTTSAA